VVLFSTLACVCVIGWLADSGHNHLKTQTADGVARRQFL